MTKDELKKFGATGLSLILAGIIGFGVAALAIGDLNKRVIDAAENLGEIKATTKRILAEQAEISQQAKSHTERNQEASKKISEIESKIRKMEKSDAAQIMDFATLLDNHPNTGSLLAKFSDIEKQSIKQCKVQLEAVWDNCAPTQTGNTMPAVETSLTPLGGGWSEWSGWQVASEWDGNPWNCIRTRIFCD